MNSPRIPELSDNTFDGMLLWFASMSEKGLMFHPDDNPADIISIESGKRLFDIEEVVVLNKILSVMFEAHGDEVYEASYPIFMKKMGIQLDA